VILCKDVILWGLSSLGVPDDRVSPAITITCEGWDDARFQSIVRKTRDAVDMPHPHGHPSEETAQA
jgi:hypothetical protein